MSKAKGYAPSYSRKVHLMDRNRQLICGRSLGTGRYIRSSFYAKTYQQSIYAIRACCKQCVYRLTNGGVNL